MIAAAAAVAAMLAGGAASAGNLPTGGVTAQEVASALQAKGYQAEIGRDSGGDPMISSALDGSSYKILFYNCKSGRCASIQFATAFDMKNGLTLAKVNSWNREKRFGRAYLDDEMDPFVEYDVDMERGATNEAITNAIDVWAAVVPAFKTYVDF
jgi:hypothetical protein